MSSPQEVFLPLLAIAESYITEASSKIDPDTFNHLKSVMRSYINDEISYNDASDIFTKSISTTRPLDRIRAILNVPATPISPTDPSTIPNGAQNGVLYNNGNGNGVNTQIVNNSSGSIVYLNGPRKKTHPWTEYEDQRLLYAIHRYGLDNWAPVSVFVGNRRTRAQCSQRWFRGLDPRISKVLWSAEEESRLLQLIERYGDRAWTKISSELGNRSDAQCRYHYRQMMKESENSSANQPHNYVYEPTNPLITETNCHQIPPVLSAPARSFKRSIGLEPADESKKLVLPFSLIKTYADNRNMVARPVLPQQKSMIVPKTRTSLPPISSIISVIDKSQVQYQNPSAT